MAVIKTLYGASALPIAFSRGNPIPLDKTEIWYSLDELKTYAQSSVVAYVGQIVTYVDQDNNTATAYIITNTAGDLQEVGTGAVSYDNITIEANAEGAAALKDFGKKYYKWIATVEAQGTEGEEGYVAAVPGHYEEQAVDTDHPWKAGLELRTVDGTNIGWYEQNTETTEGLNAAVAAVQSDMTDLRKQVESLASAFSFKGELTLAENQTEAEALAAVTDPRAGDVYQIGDNEWVYAADQGWIELGPNIDLSSYAKQTDLTAVDGRLTTLENTVNGLTAADGKITVLETKVSTIETTLDNLTKTDGTIDALDDRVGDLETLVGKPAEGDTVATGLYAVIGDFITGVQLDGTDLTISDGKVQLSTFNGTVTGLVPVIGTLAEGEVAANYVLNAEGKWVKPQDERIGDLGDYSTVVEYVDAKAANATLTWSAITE